MPIVKVDPFRELTAMQDQIQEHECHAFGIGGELLDRPAAEVWLAYVDHECAGFALFFTNYSTFLGKPGLYLEDVFVKAHLRRKGIGLALLKKLAAIARERDYGRMEWSVLGWNDPAISFYKKLGAVPLEEWTMFRLTGEALANFT